MGGMRALKECFLHLSRMSLRASQGAGCMVYARYLLRSSLATRLCGTCTGASNAAAGQVACRLIRAAEYKEIHATYSSIHGTSGCECLLLVFCSLPQPPPSIKPPRPFPNRQSPRQAPPSPASPGRVNQICVSVVLGCRPLNCVAPPDGSAARPHQSVERLKKPPAEKGRFQ